MQNWRQAILEILRECNKDPIKHDRMVRLRDLVAGRLRPLLSSSPKGMNVPVMIDEGLVIWRGNRIRSTSSKLCGIRS